MYAQSAVSKFVETSKLNHRYKDSRKLMLEVQRATYRALRATIFGSWSLMVRMNSAPARGRKINKESMGNPLIKLLTHVPKQIPSYD